ncbi:MAG: N-acetylmuramoyl-L-alanine amidase [Aestuariivirgaceae bacterium]
MLLCACFFVLASTSAQTQETVVGKPPPKASATRLGGDNAKTRFVAELSYAIGYNVYVIPDPFRVILDLPQIDFDLSPSSGTRGRGLVSGYRFGRIDDERSRVVLDATGPVLIDKSFILNPRDGQPARLVVDLIRTDRKTFDQLHVKEQPQPPPAPERLIAAVSQQPGKAATTEPTLPVDEPVVSPGYPDNVAESPIAPRPPRPSTAPLDSIAMLLNAKRIIVLDPGHGGIDPGALSRSRKIREKDIVLRFARTLKKKLDASGRYKVIMTRNDDRFLKLQERVKIARNANADLFIAIHADSIRGRSARGATVYTVSDQASDEEAAELAHKENRADIIAGVDLANESDEITGILIDLAQRETKNYSISAAKKMVRQMKTVTRLNSRPLRSAGFRVLMAPDVPSILLELGYLSNKADERLLMSSAWHKKVTRALSKAIDGYFATQLALDQDRF